LRTHLAEGHSLFLANIIKINGNKSLPIFPVTIANWIKVSLKEAEINNDVFKAHSLRSAVYTKAVSNGASIHSVKMHAN
jgi:site-specific recombinase XerD